MSDFPKAWGRLRAHFNYDEAKIHLWFTTSNPMLGGTSPVMMLVNGREAKLARFINHQLGENDCSV